MHADTLNNVDSGNARGNMCEMPWQGAFANQSPIRCWRQRRRTLLASEMAHSEMWIRAARAAACAKCRGRKLAASHRSESCECGTSYLRLCSVLSPVFSPHASPRHDAIPPQVFRSLSLLCSLRMRGRGMMLRPVGLRRASQNQKRTLRDGRLERCDNEKGVSRAS